MRRRHSSWSEVGRAGWVVTNVVRLASMLRSTVTAATISLRNRASHAVSFAFRAVIAD